MSGEEGKMLIFLSPFPLSGGTGRGFEIEGKEFPSPYG